MMRRVNILCSFALLFASQNSLAVTYPLPPEGSRLVGQSLTVTVPDPQYSAAGDFCHAIRARVK